MLLNRKTLALAAITFVALLGGLSAPLGYLSPGTAGQSNLNNLVIWMVGFIGIFFCVTILLINQFVLRQVALLRGSIWKIVQSGDDSRRLEIKNHETLPNVAAEINGLLDFMEKQHRAMRNDRDELEAQLAGRIKQLTRTSKELAEEQAARAKAEQLLRRSEELFGKAFRATSVPLAICTLAEGQFLEVNESFVELLGFKREEVIGCKDVELGIWAEASARERWLQLVIEKRSVRDFECRFRTKSGEFRNLLASAEVFQVGQSLCVLFSTYDITERVSQEVQLRQAHKMEAVGQLAAGFAHDFNNILAIVQGYTSLLLAEMGQEHPASKPLKEISTAAERAANLTRQLLTFSRKQFMQPKTLDLNLVIKRLENMLQRLLGESIGLKFDWADPTLSVRADTGMVEQLIVNLAVNARDAMRNGGQFTVCTSTIEIDAAYVRTHPEARPGRFACVTLIDTGCGMDTSTLSRIFEPFFTTKEVGKGTGLGLATVYGIVKQHQGWIEVASQPKQGTTFKVFLPVAEPVIVTAPEKPVVAPITGGKEFILLVEDEPGLRVMVQGILERYGYTVVSAGNGVEAFQVWEQHKENVDLLLTDMVMPEGVTGKQLADKLKNQKPSLKVIYTSGYSLELMGEDMEPLTEGLNFLQKPYRPQILAQTLRNCLDAGEAEQIEYLARTPRGG